MQDSQSLISIEPQKQKNSHLVYIASTGRSGSTLLELLLASFEHVWTMGEIYVLPLEIKHNNRPCGCGKEVTECTFWSQIIKKNKILQKTDNNISLFRENYSGGKFFRIKELLDIIFRKNITKFRRLNEFCIDNSHLFTAIQQEAIKFTQQKIKYLIDSSKDFYRLFWLSNCYNIDLKVIHIVKNPQAYVYSNIKTKQNFLVKIKQSIRMSIRYVIENWLIEKICNNLPKKNYILIRYEDLASSPLLVLRKISDWLQLPFESHIVSSFRFKVNHGIAGNMMRYNVKNINLDEQWKQDMSLLNRMIVILFAFIYYIKYGYNF